jgi:hypothetical protein
VLIVQIATSVLPAFEVATAWLRWVMVALAIGFPFWLAFAWFYEFTPEGTQARERGRAARVDHAPHRPQARLAIIGVLALAMVLLLTDRSCCGGGEPKQPRRVPSNRSRCCRS